jgi:hypothetical protein
MITKTEIGTLTEDTRISPVFISFEDGQRCSIKMNFGDDISYISSFNDTTVDFFVLAATVYTLDRYFPRKKAFDSWTRNFSINIPVSNPRDWNKNKQLLERCLSFLTGDIWNTDFYEKHQTLFSQSGLPFLPYQGIKLVSLFSGGLDSLIGSINSLENSKKEPIILVGHHDPRISGVKADQLNVLDALEPYYGNRIIPQLISIGPETGYETTFRSRSILFISLGLLFSNSLGDDIPLLIPENGTISLNIPLTPSRTGSCSTRTVHPTFLKFLMEFLQSVEINNQIINPLSGLTKGECVTNCLNLQALKDAVRFSSSCAKSGHTRTWIRRDANQCGRCMPCIYRRAALHQINFDNQPYGRDICSGEVDPDSAYLFADDFRACLSFLKRNPTNNQIKQELLANGRLETDKLDVYAQTVVRAMEEIRCLIKDKGIDEIKRKAGIM